MVSLLISTKSPRQLNRRKGFLTNDTETIRYPREKT